MFSTYWDSAERARIVSNNFFHPADLAIVPMATGRGKSAVPAKFSDLKLHQALAEDVEAALPIHRL
jgi:hypothetical protein